VYRALRPVLFSLAPETAHSLAIRVARFAAHSAYLSDRLAREFCSSDPRLAVDVFGLRFPAPVGVAAGLDKDAHALPFWPSLGFGHVEVGTVTPEPQAGNPLPRIVRLRADSAIVNAMGFPSVGAEALARRLADWKASGRWPSAPVGVNVGKNRDTPLAQAAEDYRRAIAAVGPYADFLVVNVSSPNTPGLRDLQDEALLNDLLSEASAAAGATPVLVKLSPDLSDRALARLAERSAGWGLSGIVATNTTVRRAGLRIDPGATGGLSGPPLAARARQVVRVLRAATTLPIVSVGGIDGPAEAIRRFEAGADLLQLYTGLIYQGPSLARRINEGVAAELDRRGAAHLRELRTEA